MACSIVVMDVVAAVFLSPSFSLKSLGLKLWNSEFFLGILMYNQSIGICLN